MGKMTVEFLNDLKAVNIITNDGVKKNEKIVSINDFLISILESTNKNKLNSFTSPLHEIRKGIDLIQSKSFGSNSTVYILFRKKGYAPMPHYNRMYENVGVPNLIFAVRVVNNRLSQLYTVATKDEVITNDTTIYKYPFTNVNGGTGLVCTGANKFEPGIEDNNYKLLYDVPNKFFSMPNNQGYDNCRSNKYKSVEEVFRKLNNNEFDEDILVRSPFLNYKDFIQKL